MGDTAQTHAMAYQNTNPVELTCQRALQSVQGASCQHLALGVLERWAVVLDPGWLLVLQFAGGFGPMNNAAETLQQFCKGLHECVNGLAVCFTVVLLSLSRGCVPGAEYGTQEGFPL